MNVDTFAPNPSIKWYFISAVPLMVVVLLFWYFIKHALAHERQTPYQRGIYEEMFYKMATAYPQLWSRTGPRNGIKPQSIMGRLKWRLIQSWNDPAKTIRKGPGEDSEYDDLGAWARVKRILTRRWTNQMRSFEDLGISASLIEGGGKDDDVSTMTEADGHTIELYTAPALYEKPQDENRLGVPQTQPFMQPASVQSRISTTTRNSSGKRPDSSGAGSQGRNSGIMVEEEPASWLQDTQAVKAMAY